MISVRREGADSYNPFRRAGPGEPAPVAGALEQIVPEWWHVQFRNDIQILRAIAVTAVLLFHLGVKGTSSGFLGVDVFFVVSGFLMEKLYSLNRGAGRFYLRRAQRLLPAYFAVVLATLCACYFITIPPDFSQVAQQTAFASAFGSNIGFWFQNSYFSKIEFNPLLHLWSLGVEIQYYIFVPLVAWGAARSRGLLPALIIVSLLLCFAVVEISPKTSFFIMPLRLWEFALGMLVARLAPEQTRRSAAGVVAMLGIVACMMLPVNGEATSFVQGHPGLAALAIALLTAIALYCGVEDRILTNPVGRILRKIGDMSYSIYLVHFPIIVLWFYTPFGGTRLGTGTWTQVIPIAFVIAVAAPVSYFVLERRGGRLLKPSIVVAAMAVASTTSILLPPLQARSFTPDQRAIFSASTNRGAYRCGIAFRFAHPRSEFCLFRASERTRETAMLLGDSHADAIKQSFARAVGRRGVKVAFAVSNEPLLSPGRGPQWMVSQARSLGVRRVFLHYSFHNLSLALVENARRANSAAGIETILILPVPEAHTSIPQVMYRASVRGPTSLLLERSQYDRVIYPYVAYAATAPPMLTIVDPRNALCGAAGCAIAQRDSRPYYFDRDHLTLLGADRLESEFDLALAPRGRF